VPGPDDALLVRGSPLGWWRSGVAEWHALADTTKVRAKVAVLVGATVVAFHYSLVSLIQTVGLDTPLAYVGLVPMLAALLAWINRSSRVPEPPVHDRQLDYILGVPMVVLTVVAGLVLPSRLGAMFWVNRIDLALLPVFATGATMLLFGVRVAWRQRVALAYLFLAWPWLYTAILLGTLGGFTSITLRGLDAVLRVVHVASPVGGSANAGLYVVSHQGHLFPVDVVTACSGVDGMVGFFLIGAALAAVVEGGLRRKLLWLCTGLVLLWVTNLLRLLGIFWVGAHVGERVAIGVLHPVAGLVMFALGVGIMASLLRPFGLRVRPRPVMPSTAASADAAPAVFVVAGLVIGAALVLSVANAGLTVFDPVAGASGEPKLASFLADPATPAGWTVAYQTEFESNKPLFGEDSRWFRYLYVPAAAARTSLRSTLPVTADVIDAGGLGGFDAYGVTACYSFHGYTLDDVADVGLGDGIVGQALSWRGGTSHQDWSIVYWIWPVETGSGTRFERVVLSLQNTAAGSVSLAPWTPGVAAPPGRSADPVTRRLAVNRAFLVAFARQIVAGQSSERDTGVFVDRLLAPGSGVQWAAGHPLRLAGSGPGAANGAPSTSSGAQSSTSSQASVAFWQAYFAHHPRVATGGR